MNSRLYEILAEHENEYVMIDDGNPKIKLGSEWLKEKPYSNAWKVIYQERSKADYYDYLIVLA